MKQIDKWLDLIDADKLFGISAIPFFLTGICFFNVDGDKSDWLYKLLGSIFSAITIYLWVKIYRKVNG